MERGEEPVGRVVWTRLRAIARVEARLLLGLPAAQRRDKVRRAKARFKNPILVDLLLAESQARLSACARDALELADCAQAVALRIPHQEVGAAIALTAVARANAHRANALRASGKIQQAQPVLASAIHLFEQEGTGDPLVEGELLELSAALRREERRFVEAERALNAAQTLYQRVREPGRVARVLVMRCHLQFEAGEHQQGVNTGRLALATIDRELEPWLYLCAVHNLLLHDIELGEFARARQALLDHDELYRRFDDPVVVLRRRWAEGLIARGCEDWQEAEQLLRLAGEGFAGSGLTFDAALVGLDLAQLFIATGRTAEVRRLAAELAPVFTAEGVHREAAAALLLFRQAAEREVVTLSMLVELVHHLRRIRSGSAEDPS